ncbi:hypothetical protein TNCV_3357611 [Trichonephila clavipes]|nr:hypothetical protein TNCV_3357611 [Trichonephila clavipes]
MNSRCSGPRGALAPGTAKMARANERAGHVTVTSGPPGKKKVYLAKSSSHSKNGRGQVKQVVVCMLISFPNPCALLRRKNSTGKQRTPWPMPSERWVSSPFPTQHRQFRCPTGTEVWDPCWNVPGTCGLLADTCGSSKLELHSSN